MNTFLEGQFVDPTSGHILSLVNHHEVLRPGVKVERRGLKEGGVTIAGVDLERKLVALRHEGYTSYINRAVGSQYSEARVTLHRFELSSKHGSHKEGPDVLGVYLSKQIADVPIAR